MSCLYAAYNISILGVGIYPFSEGYHPLFSAHILAPGCGSVVVTAEGQRAGSRGVLQLD